MLWKNFTFKFNSAIFLRRPISIFELDTLETSHIYKNHNDIVNCDLAIPSLSDLCKFYKRTKFSYSFLSISHFINVFFSCLLLVNFLNLVHFFLNSVLLFLLLSLYSSSFCIRAPKSTFLFFTDAVMINVSKTAISLMIFATQNDVYLFHLFRGNCLICNRYYKTNSYL